MMHQKTKALIVVLIIYSIAVTAAFYVLASGPVSINGTYRGWLIFEVKESYTMNPSGQKISVFVALKLGDGYVLFGIDIPDLKADIDEAER